MLAFIADLPAVRRHRTAISYGLCLAMLTLLLLSAVTALAVQSIGLGELRYIGTDSGLMSGLVSRLIVGVACVVAVVGWAVRSYSRPAQVTPRESIVVSAAIRLTAGTGLLVIALTGALLSNAARLFG